MRDLLGSLTRRIRWLGRRRSDADLRTVEMIATVSHEIRSPLTTIKGFTKTLLDRWDRLSDEVKREMLMAVNADADRVTRLLGELLDVSRMEAGKLSLHLQRVDVCSLVREVAESLQGRSEGHEIELSSSEAVEVRADPDKLRQVVSNFVENALKYTETGVVTVGCERERGWGLVTVTDQGKGIPPEALEGLFEKFARHDVPGVPTGTGLGLYICKGLIEAHGGQIGATSRDGVGSSFWFRVPLADGEASDDG